ncbi:MAG: type II secretion system F family protein [Bdellovibrionales bacterium]
MPAYAYRAVYASGRISCGEMTASNENELGHYLKESGLELIDAREKKENIFRPSFLKKRISPRVLADFCSRLHDLLKAGIAFPDALRDARTFAGPSDLADALVQISQAIANGKGIASSFALYPSLFPPLFTAIIGAGEKSGDMSVTFDYLSRYAKNHADAQERMRRALRYPFFMFLVAGGATAFMMTMVIPQVIQFLNSLGGQLPLATRLLIAASTFFVDYGAIFLASLVGLGLLVVFLRKTIPSFGIAYDSVRLHLPVIGNIIAKTEIARFTYSFYILFRNGCDMAACFRQAGETLNNLALRAGVEKAEQRVMDGASLSLALQDVFPPFVVEILRTGERSGNLEKSLNDIVIAYDREATNAVNTFIGLLEPCLTLIVGALLAWTVLATLGPLYGSLSVLGGQM